MCLLPANRWTEQRSIARALALARKNAAFASPNPTVGCVLTRDGILLGEGAHHFDRRDHAEIAALKSARAAGHEVRGATACVTLEPCSHHGRTGPCADALVAAGITRCVVATVDPNPLVRGSGLARLRAAGVEVELLPTSSAEAQQARRLNDAFAFSIQHGRPMVTLKAALSLDGRLAPPPGTRRTGQPFWLTGPAARADVARLRHSSDALLTGIGTVLADDPQLTDRSGLPRRRPLLRVLLDSALRLPIHSRLVRDCAGDLLVVCNHGAEARRRDDLRRFPLELVSVEDLHSSAALAQVFELLQQREIRSVLTEAGSALNGALLAGGLIDKVVLYFADTELGEQALPFASGGLSPYELQKQLSSPGRAVFPHGITEDVRLDGYLHDPWEGI